MKFCRHRLLYWYLENRSVADQAAQCWWTIHGALEQGEGIMLDAEHDCTEEQAYTWLTLMEGYTRRPSAVYTNKNVDGGRIWKSTRIFDGTRARIFPHYNASQLETLNLALPYGWDVWQHSSTGGVPGIEGNVDLDQVDDWEIFETICGWR